MNNEIDTLIYFVFNSVAIRYKETDEYPKNLKFVFNNDGINELEYLVNNKLSKDYRYYLYKKDISNILCILKSNLYEYLYNRDDNINYIYIDDINKFKEIIYKLYKSIGNDLNGCEYEFRDSYLAAVWLRMSPNDLNDIYSFLNRQIEINNSNYFVVPEGITSMSSYEYYETLYNNKVMYTIKSAGSWYESNRLMSILLKNENCNSLILPEICFSVIEENNRKICYLYAIQTCKNIKQDDIVEDSLLNLKKKLRNKYVNYKFPLALHYFIKIMKSNEIYDIKVPLLQILNYDYHVSMSENYKKRMFSIEEKIKKSYIKKECSDYDYIKEIADKVVDKEDIISKNKTERLVETFMIIEDIFKDIKILNDPFIEDENLNVKILRKI